MQTSENVRIFDVQIIFLLIDLFKLLQTFFKLFTQTNGVPACLEA